MKKILTIALIALVLAGCTPKNQNTTGNQTYQDTELGIEFNYPQNYEVLIQPTYGFIYTEHVTDKPLGFGNIITVKNEPIETLTQELKDSLSKIENYQETPLIIDGQESLRVQYDPTEGTLPTNNVKVFIRKGEQTFILTKGFGSDEEFNQLIDSFKFIK